MHRRPQQHRDRHCWSAYAGFHDTPHPWMPAPGDESRAPVQVSADRGNGSPPRRCRRRAPSVPFGADNSGQVRIPETEANHPAPGKHTGQRRLIVEESVIPMLRAQFRVPSPAPCRSPSSAAWGFVRSPGISGSACPLYAPSRSGPRGTSIPGRRQGNKPQPGAAELQLPHDQARRTAHGCSCGCIRRLDWQRNLLDRALMPSALIRDEIKALVEGEVTEIAPRSRRGYPEPPPVA